MKTLFDETSISGMKLKNRIIRSATNDNAADKEGYVTEELLQIYETLAKGGVGAIITGLAHVTDVEKLIDAQMGIYNDSFIVDYQKLTEAVHQYDSKIILQMTCNGVQTKSTADGLLWGPSAVEDLAYKQGPKEMTKDEIGVMVESFKHAALRAKKAGFDGVQIHAAHGYLLSKFLTPYYNRRTDEYGGSIENRARALLETYTAVRKEVGEEYPVLVKINCDDFMDQGMTFAECRYVCKVLEQAGISAIEVSGGSPSSRRNEGVIRKITPENESYFKEYAEEIAREIETPVILVGGNRDFNRLTDLINQTEIEYISLSRPFIREADLVKRWQSGDQEPAKCISCTKCFSVGATRCIFN